MKRAISVAAVSALLGSTPVAAAVSDEEFAQFKADFAALAARLSALEAENRELRQIGETTVREQEVTKSAVAELTASSKPGSWTDTISLKGDFRYRFESIELENASDRSRNRVRARAQLSAKLSPKITVGIGAASGSADPVSTNQSLGGGGSTKDFSLDMAYAKYQASENSWVQFGKFKNPLYRAGKSSLLWDGDWRPEGLSAGWADDRLFVNFLGNWLESDSKKSNDAFSWGLQGGAKFDLGDANLTTSLAYFDFPTAGNAAYYDDAFFGNSSTDGVYIYNYELIEVGADLGLSLFDKPFNVFANYVQNQDADDNDTGWQLGAKLGKAKGPGSWELSYRYQDLEADATLGLLTDSDFSGGGTDGKGHILSGAYGIHENWTVGFTVFDSEADENRLSGSGGALDYDRFIIDTVLKF